MKRKAFQKQLMAKGIQRNEAAYLSSEICKTHFPRGTSYAIGTCILAHVMAPTQVRMETCAGYYINAYSEICQNGQVFPDLFLPVLVALQAAERMITEIALRRAEDALFMPTTPLCCRQTLNNILTSCSVLRGERPFWIGGKNAERNQRESVVLLPAVRQEDPPGSAWRARRVCSMQATQSRRHALQLARRVQVAERK